MRFGTGSTDRSQSVPILSEIHLVDPRGTFTTYHIVGKYPVKRYRCGLRAGDSVKLRKDIRIKDHAGQPTNEVCRKGEIWIVLQGTKGVVWLRQQDGQMHTWDDDPSIYETFEKVEKTTARTIRRKSDK